jgi:hypothetical protein
VTPFDLRPGVRVRQTRTPDYLNRTATGQRLHALLGRTGTVDFVTDHKAAWIRWDDGDEGSAAADCLELVQ